MFFTDPKGITRKMQTLKNNIHNSKTNTFHYSAGNLNYR